MEFSNYFATSKHFFFQIIPHRNTISRFREEGRQTAGESAAKKETEGEGMGNGFQTSRVGYVLKMMFLLCR